MAYAVTVHRVQGLTVPAVVIMMDDLFEAGHPYVALSRVPNDEQLQVESIFYGVLKSS